MYIEKLIVGNNFNDPYEFIYKYSVKDEIFIDFLKLFYKDEYTKFFKKNMSKEEILEYTRDYYFSESRELLGAACLTENENDEIMWAHYGGNHKKDTHNTDHGNPKAHPKVPHEHDWDWTDEKIPKPGPAYSSVNWGNVGLGVGLTAVCIIGIVVVAADDATGVGVADDVLFAPLGGGVGKGLIMIFGG